MMRTFGKRVVSVELEVYEGIKYDPETHNQDSKKIRYDGVTAFEVIRSEEAAAEIEKDTDGSCIDEYHEYLVLHFENGETSTFRNSHVDLWRI